jgi:hypothetical protein
MKKYIFALTDVLRPIVANRASMMLIASVLLAARHSESIDTEKQQRARASVEVLSAVKLRSKQAAGNAAVYNLSVDDAEEYFANGILVHNCLYAICAGMIAPEGVIGVIAQTTTRGWNP